MQMWKSFHWRLLWRNGPIPTCIQNLRLCCPSTRTHFCYRCVWREQESSLNDALKMVNGLLDIESESGKAVIVMSDFWSTEGEFPNQISIKLAKKGNDINLKSVLRWKFYLASQEPHFVWVDVGDPIFSTWKSHTIFSTSIFLILKRSNFRWRFWYFEEILESGEIGICKYFFTKIPFSPPTNRNTWINVLVLNIFMKIFFEINSSPVEDCLIACGDWPPSDFMRLPLERERKKMCDESEW